MTTPDLASKDLAYEILKKEHDTFSSAHPKEDKIKGDLHRLEKSLGRPKDWEQIFDEVRTELGFNG